MIWIWNLAVKLFETHEPFQVFSKRFHFLQKNHFSSLTFIDRNVKNSYFVHIQFTSCTVDVCGVWKSIVFFSQTNVIDSENILFRLVALSLPLVVCSLSSFIVSCQFCCSLESGNTLCFCLSNFFFPLCTTANLFLSQQYLSSVNKAGRSKSSIFPLIWFSPRRQHKFVLSIGSENKEKLLI